jgi:hypothetical protein
LVGIFRPSKLKENHMSRRVAKFVVGAVIAGA